MQLVRHNAYAEMRKAPSWFIANCVRHLSVPIEMGTDKGSRFGVCWFYAGQRYGSLVRGDVVPAGLAPHVEILAKHYDIPCSVIDAREEPLDQVPWWSVTAKWRPYQEDVHKKLVRADCGVIDAPPRSGKTLMAAHIIDVRACNCVFIAPSVQIVRQTYEVLVEFYGDGFVSRLDGDAKPHQRDPSKPIVVATANSAVSMPREWWDTRDMLLIDEFHHAAADTYHKINLLASNVYWRYGFTGTHFRTGDDRLAMEAICSRTLHKIHVNDLIEGGFLAPPRVIFQAVSCAGTGGTKWDAAYRNGIVQCAERNELAARTANALLDQGIPTIVLTRHRAHADELADAISGAVAVKGGANVLTSGKVKDFVAGGIDCLVGTTVIGEGVDVPRAAALVYASGGSDGVSMMQSYFRPLTAAPGKDVGRIYDFVDRHHRMLSRHSDRRITMAREQLGSGRVFVFE